MSVDWANLDQPKFDRIVEALVRHRFGEKARAINGRGGDEGIDIAVTLDGGRVWILQLKFYPEGFSSVWGKRRTAIRKSFQTAAKKHSPAEWALVVPCLCTDAEHRYVTNLNGGLVPPKITVIDRDDLDAWMADAPSIDAHVQRTATSELREMARDFSQERAALLGGISDVTTRRPHHSEPARTS
jgi:Restriction endonuclease